MQVKHGDGEFFPNIDASKGEYFVLCLIYPGANSFEIIKVVDKIQGSGDLPGSKDTFKIVRAQEGTKALYFPAATVR